MTTTTSSNPTTQAAGDAEERAARRLRGAAIAVLVPVALVGAVLSFDGLHSRARTVFTDPLAYGFPLLVDALILGCTLAYLAGAKVGRPRSGWRLAAHAGIAGTVALNAAASSTWAEVPWHVTAPIVWSVLVELTGRELLGEWHAHHQPVRASIPARLWLTAPAESLRTWLRIARRLDGEQTAARLDVGVHAAAVHALALAVPGWRNRKVRRILRRQLRAGSLSPLAILGPLGWTDDTTATLTRIDGPAVLRAALRDAIRAASGVTDATPRPVAPGAPRPVAPVAPRPGIEPRSPAALAAESRTAFPVEPATPAATPPAGEIDEAAVPAAEQSARGIEPEPAPQREQDEERDDADQGDDVHDGDSPDTSAGVEAKGPAAPAIAEVSPAPCASPPVTAPPVVPAQAPIHAGALALDLADPAPALTSTGDRGRDAVAVLTLHGRGITYHQLAEHLTALGWTVPTGTSTRQRILTDARRAYDAARASSRLAVVR